MHPSELPTDDATVEARLRTLRSTCARVDLDALAANYLHLRERARGAGVLCVVKADAYGHGAVPVARRLESEGATRFAVAVVEEGVELREAGVGGQVLLLGSLEPGQAGLALDHGVTPSIVSAESLDVLDAEGRRRGEPVACHLKLDTGMTRLGIPWTETSGLAERLSRAAVRVEGLFTHLACSDDPSVPFTRTQLERFRECRARLREFGVQPELVHVASSAGLLTRAEQEVSLVRPGLALYGLNPFGNERAPELSPVLSWVSRVVRLARVPPGTGVGYGSTFLTVRESLLATIPVGYDDGLRRALSGDWEVAIRGRRVPLVGRVSMDLVVADVTDLEEVAVGDEVGVVGGDAASGALPVEAMAHRLKTIPHEITSSISPRVPRVLVADGRVVEIRSRFEHLGGLARVPAPS